MNPNASQEFLVGPWLVVPDLNLISQEELKRTLEPKVMALLVYLAGTEGRVIHRDELIEHVWEGQIVNEGTLNWSIAQLRKVLGDKASAPTFIETVPKKGYRLIADVSHGLPSTTQVLPATSDLEESLNLNPLPKPYYVKSWLWAVAILLLITTALFFGLKKSHGEAPVKMYEAKSIAVLPFLNLSTSDDNDYFSDGLSEELMNSLAKIKGLKVAARTSAFAFKNQNRPISDIAKDLGVGVVLEGSVRREADRLRISVRLVSASDGYQLWGQTYDRNLGDVFVIQNEIASSIAQALELALFTETGETFQVSTPQLSAYDQYLLGRYYFHKRTETSLNQSIQYFTQAIELDPKFALAYTGLSDATAMLTIWGNKAKKDIDLICEPTIQKALKLAPGLAEAHTSLGGIRFEQRRFQEAVECYQTALQLNPNYATAYQWLADTLRRMNRFQEARTAMEKALALDPLSPIINLDLGVTLDTMGLMNEGLSYLEKAIQLDPQFAGAHRVLGSIHFMRGNHAKALNLYDKALELAPEDKNLMISIGSVYYELGDLKTAHSWLERARAVSPEAGIFLAIALFLQEDNLEGARSMIELAIARQPQDYQTQLAAAYLGFCLGDFKMALTWSQSVFGSWSSMTPDLDNYDDMVRMAWIYRQMGEEDVAKTLLDRAQTYLQDVLATGYAIPYAYCISAAIRAMNDQPGALDQLQKAVDLGWRGLWEIENSPIYENIRNDPGFSQAITRMNSALQSELIQLKTIQPLE